MHINFIIPNSIDTPTGGYRYDRAMINEWRKAGHHVTLSELEGSFPFATKQEKQKALLAVDALKGDIFIVDGLFGGAFPDFLEKLSQNHPVIALIHHPLFLENGLSGQDKAHLFGQEKQGLSFVKAVVVTSPATAREVHKAFSFDKSHIHQVLPAVKRPAVERGEINDFKTESPFKILSIGSISERKGHDILIAALENIKEKNWTLDIVGPSHFNPSLFESLKKQVLSARLDDKITFHGAVDEASLKQFHQKAHLFALASRYEGYGMVYAEAIVRGLPVLGTKAGAIPDTVPQEAGLLVEADNIKAFQEGLERFMQDKTFRHEKHKGCLKVANSFPTWEKSASQFIEILKAYS